MDTKHYHFTRNKNYKKPTTSMKPYLKPSGHNSSFPFLNSCLPQKCLSSPSSVFTFANFKMYFYSPCVSQYPSSYFPSESFHSYFGLFRKTNAYQLWYVIKMTATGDSSPKTCFCRYWEYIFIHTILQPAFDFWAGCSFTAILKPITPSFPIERIMLRQD